MIDPRETEFWRREFDFLFLPQPENDIDIYSEKGEENTDGDSE